MMLSTWNKILQSYTFQNKALLPYEEWNIDFSELTVGTRVGIGKHLGFYIFLSELAVALPCKGWLEFQQL